MDFGDFWGEGEGTGFGGMLGSFLR